MDFHRRFTLLVCAPAFEVEDLEGIRLGQIIVAIEKQGFQVVRGASDRGCRDRGADRRGLPPW